MHKILYMMMDKHNLILLHFLFRFVGGVEGHTFRVNARLIFHLHNLNLVYGVEQDIFRVNAGLILHLHNLSL